MAYRMRMVLSVSAAVAAVGLAVGCGTAGAGTPTAAPTGFAAYTACLAQNGVTLPSNFERARPSGSAFPRPSGSGFPRPSGSPGRGGNAGFGGGFGGFGDNPPAGVDEATWQKALQACATLRPSGGPGAGGNNSAFAAYRNCLSEHGVTASTGTNQLNSSDPTVAAAMKACEPLRPTGGPRATPRPT